jgi:hypothetical protein
MTATSTFELSHTRQDQPFGQVRHQPSHLRFLSVLRPAAATVEQYGYLVTYRGKTLSTGLAAAAVALAAVATPAQAQSSDSMPSFNGTVLTVAYSGNVLFLGGDFTAAIVRGKPVTRAHLAAVDSGSGALLSWAPAADGRVKALVVGGGSVYFAGDFGTVGGQKRDSLVRVDATSVFTTVDGHTPKRFAQFTFG